MALGPAYAEPRGPLSPVRIRTAAEARRCFGGPPPFPTPATRFWLTFEPSVGIHGSGLGLRRAQRSLIACANQDCCGGSPLLRRAFAISNTSNTILAIVTARAIHASQSFITPPLCAGVVERFDVPRGSGHEPRLNTSKKGCERDGANLGGKPLWATGEVQCCGWIFTWRERDRARSTDMRRGAAS